MLAPAGVEAQALSPQLLEEVRRGAADVELPAGPMAVPLVGDPTVPLVEVLLESRGPYRFLIDLGSNVTILRRDIVDEVGLHIEVERDASDIVRAESLTIGSLAYRDVVMAAYDELDVDGVIGYNILSRLPFVLDYPSRRLVLGLAATGEDDLELVIESRLPYLRARLGEHEFLLNLDTGASEDATFPAAWRSWLPMAGEPVSGPETFNNQTGAVRVEVARLSEDLIVGPMRISGLEVYLNPDVEDAWLGSGYLQNFAVAIDPRSGRARLTPAQ